MSSVVEGRRRVYLQHQHPIDTCRPQRRRLPVLSGPAAIEEGTAVNLPLSTFLLVLTVADASGDAASRCNQFEDRAQQIKGCTEYIRQGTAPGPNLAIAYTNRGIAHASNRRFKLAIADFTEAIRLTPDSPLPYYNRANA